MDLRLRVVLYRGATGKKKLLTKIKELKEMIKIQNVSRVEETQSKHSLLTIIHIYSEA